MDVTTESSLFLSGGGKLFEIAIQRSEGYFFTHKNTVGIQVGIPFGFGWDTKPNTSAPGKTLRGL